MAGKQLGERPDGGARVGLLAMPQQNGLLRRVAENVRQSTGGVLDGLHTLQAALPAKPSRLRWCWRCRCWWWWCSASQQRAEDIQRKAGLLRRLARVGDRRVVLLPWLAAVGFERLIGRVDPHHLRLFAQRVVDELFAVIAGADPLPVAGAISDWPGGGVGARHDIGSHRECAVVIDGGLGPRPRRPGGRSGRRRGWIGIGKAGGRTPAQRNKRRGRDSG